MENNLLLPTVVPDKGASSMQQDQRKKRSKILLKARSKLSLFWWLFTLTIVFIIGFKTGKHLVDRSCVIECPFGYESSTCGWFFNDGIRNCRCKAQGIVNKKRLNNDIIPLLLKKTESSMGLNWFVDMKPEASIKYWKESSTDGHWEVPYYFQHKFEEAELALIQSAFSKISSQTCVEFRERNANDSTVLTIVNDEDSCWSYLGKTESTEVSLSAECMHKQGVLHMLMISLGFDQSEKTLWKDILSKDGSQLTNSNEDGLDSFDISRINDVYKCQQVKGTVGEWSEWVPCSKSCGGGESYRHRTCTDAKGRPAKCAQNQFERKNCMQRRCEFYTTVWEEWSKWGKCSKICGGGLKMRSRNCSSDRCMGLSSEAQQCNAGICHETDQSSDLSGAGWSSWSPWGRCSVTCGLGFKVRSRECWKDGEMSKDCDGEYILPTDNIWHTGIEHKECTLRACVALHTPSLKIADGASNDTHSVSKRSAEKRSYNLKYKKSSDYPMVCVTGYLYSGHFTSTEHEDLACYVSTGGLNVLGPASMGFNDLYSGSEGGCWAAHPYGSEEPPTVFIADFDGDGFDDYACFHEYTKSLVIISNGQEKPFQSEGRSFYDALHFEKCLDLGDYYYQVADLNGDGKADVMCGAKGGPIKYVFYNNNMPWSGGLY